MDENSMSNMLTQILVSLLAAHFLADFILQTDEDVKRKQSILVFSKQLKFDDSKKDLHPFIEFLQNTC